jgi:hypothetical protein
VAFSDREAKTFPNTLSIRRPRARGSGLRLSQEIEWSVREVESIPISVSKSGDQQFPMAYDQRVVINNLWNEKVNAREIIQRFQPESGEESYALRMIQFWIRQLRRGRQDIHDDPHLGRFPFDDICAKTLVILEKSPFKSGQSIAKSLLVVTRQCYCMCVSPLSSILSSRIGIDKSSRANCVKSEDKVHTDSCRSHLTPNEKAGLTSRLVMRDSVAAKPRTDIQSKSSCSWSCEAP